jgi:glutamine---fructose-6-phosphate transaminase (isomerizing)
MCGIIGVSQSVMEGSGKIVYEALTRLEYRGYDSVGIAIIGPNGKITVEKDKGAIKEVGDKLAFSSLMGTVAIGHSRWATHGPPSKENAHPHISEKNRVAVVHNGIIENYYELKLDLQALGFKFRSETDTEVIAHLAEHLLDQGLNVLDTVKEITTRIKGTFAIVMVTTDEPSRIYAFRRDNPLVLGIGEGKNYCASDIPAFLPYTNNVIVLRDNELAILDPDKYEIINLQTWKPIIRSPKKITWTAEAAQKGGFPHFMLKEIHEQSKVLTMQLATQEQEFIKATTLIDNSDKIILIAAGTAYHASLTLYHTLPKYSRKVVLPCIAAEWDTLSNLVDDKTLIITVSQSGETLDTIKAVKDGIDKGAKVLAVVNVTDSTLTRLANNVIYIHAGPEIGVAATKTYIAQVFALWRLVYTYCQKNQILTNPELIEFQKAIENTPKLIERLIQLHELKAKDISKWLATKNSAFYLGRGISFVTAAEGALKMKEIAYIHAEAYPAGESKHGPIALVEKDYPIIFTIPNDRTRDKMIGSVQEMKARGATAIGIIEEGDEELSSLLDHKFEIPKGVSNFVSTIAYQIPQQLLAYYTTTQRGYDPDRPRNLAKSVTVE